MTSPISVGSTDCVVLVGVCPSKHMVQGEAFFTGEDMWGKAEEKMDSLSEDGKHEGWQWFMLPLCGEEKDGVEEVCAPHE